MDVQSCNKNIILRLTELFGLVLMIFMLFVLSGCQNDEMVYPVEVLEKSELSRDELKELKNEGVAILDDDESMYDDDSDNDSYDSLDSSEEVSENEVLELSEIVISSETPDSIRKITNEEDVNAVKDSEGNPVTEKGDIVVDLFIFMGQSNMSGVGGCVDKAPIVPGGMGYEYKAISDPDAIYPIEEPFGKNESFIGGICDFPGVKQGSLVSSFALKYYEETGIPIVAISASEGATTSEKWRSESYQEDLINRYKKAINWLENNGFKVRKRFAIWLQGESDAEKKVTAEEYVENMDNVIKGLFISGLNKVFIITPGRTLTYKHFFDTIIDCQIEMCRTSGYYALATTALSGISAEYLVDEWHYNQYVLDMLGEQAAESVAYYVENKKEKCLYDYRHETTYIPDQYDYTGDEVVEPLDLSNPKDLLTFRPREEVSQEEIDEEDSHQEEINQEETENEY